MPNVKDIIDQEKIFDILAETQRSSEGRVLEILDKVERKKGLDLEEVGFLVNVKDPVFVEKIFKVAGLIKKEIYGERLVLFAPLYVSNFCVNNCRYCGFHCSNPAARKKLTFKEVSEQVRILEDMGHKRLLLEFGEHPEENPIDYVVGVIKTVYETKSGKGEIRRVNVNIAADTIENYRKLKAAGIGTYQLFQETYHRETYEKMHSGPKADYERQLFAHDRAFEAGLDDLGLGVLFGLYDWKFEVLGLVSHARYLDGKFGVGPHTFSVPRFQEAETVDIPLPHRVPDEDFLKIIAVLRMAVPYTGMIISTRERPEIRKKAFEIGISQASSASCTVPGGYKKNGGLPQFNLGDLRSLPEFMEDILKQELLPSFCTACYRTGRTGKAFMDLAKPGDINNFCRPNALLTFQEYLEDYALPEIKKNGEKVVESYLKRIPDAKIRAETIKRLGKIKMGERDLFF